MDSTNSLVIETHNLTKTYKDVQALKDFNLKLTPGILGLLGPNGAGKSTLMRMLATITTPSGGSILWNGVDVVKNPEPLRSVLGYLPQDFGVYPNLSAQEFLEYMAAIKGMRGKKAKQKFPLCWTWSTCARLLAARWAVIPAACASAWALPRRCSTTPSC